MSCFVERVLLKAMFSTAQRNASSADFGTPACGGARFTYRDACWDFCLSRSGRTWAMAKRKKGAADAFRHGQQCLLATAWASSEMKARGLSPIANRTATMSQVSSGLVRGDPSPWSGSIHIVVRSSATAPWSQANGLRRHLVLLAEHHALLSSP